ncbi:Uncharacterised protein [Segatella copri]|nr:Uncharacterised protein [Segatella copri]
MCHESQGSQAVFYAAIDDAFLDKAFLSSTVGASKKGSSMNHHKYREFVILTLGWCFHTEV